MVTNYLDNNHLKLVGRILSEKKFSHEIYGESFYVFDIEVPRLSGSVDLIPITISERLITSFELEIGKSISIEGQFRSYNSYENERNRLVLTVFAKDITDVKIEEVTENEENNETENVENTVEQSENKEVKKQEDHSNEVVLRGYVCKKPIYRQTPFGREIADILLAVNRAYNKSDYIPCICWGRNARFCQDLEVGKEVKIYGRVQSRVYEKKIDENTTIKKVAYEVSVANMEIIEKESNENDENIEIQNENAV